MHERSQERKSTLKGQNVTEGQADAIADSMRHRYDIPTMAPPIHIPIDNAPIPLADADERAPTEGHAPPKIC